MDYPANAQKIVNKNTSQMFYVRFKIPTRLYADIWVQKTGEISLNEWVEQNLQQMNRSEDYQKAEIKVENWEQMEAAKKITVENYPSGTRQIRQTIILTKKENKAYRIIFTTNQDKFSEAWNNYFKIMAQSFKTK